MKLGDLKGALLDTDFAMREGDNNVKALYRQGQVSICYFGNDYCIIRKRVSAQAL